MLEFAVPFALADRQPVGLFKLFGIAIEQSADIPADDFLARPAINAFGPLVPKENFSLKVADEDRIARLVEKRRLFRDLFLRPFPFGDVGEGDDRPGDDLILRNGIRGVLDRDRAAVFSPKNLRVNVTPLAILKRAKNGALLDWVNGTVYLQKTLLCGPRRR